MASISQPAWQSELEHQLDLALQTGYFTPLEALLIARDSKEDTPQRPELIRAFAGYISQIVTSPDPPVEQLETLLDGWAALPLSSTTTPDQHVILPVLAVASYGQVAEVRPNWWSDEIRKLHLTASHPYPEVRAAVINALQQLLQSAQKQHASLELQSWLKEKNPLVVEVARSSLNVK